MESGKRRVGLGSRHCIGKAEQESLVDTRRFSHVEHFVTHITHLFVYFLAEEEITFSKIEIPKKSELFPENLRYGHA